MAKRFKVEQDGLSMIVLSVEELLTADKEGFDPKQTYVISELNDHNEIAVRQFLVHITPADRFYTFS